MPKSLKERESSFVVPATVSGSQPGDFELGSPKSRAAARALIDGRNNYNPVPPGLDGEELTAWLRAQPDEVLDAVIAYESGKTIAEARKMFEEDAARDREKQDKDDEWMFGKPGMRSSDKK